ncbi:MAG: amino acid ABC transporter permease [Thermaerobacter sp.]|nr:amino acid ABC transporter permease [Thermaerobacter sp.]
MHLAWLYAGVILQGAVVTLELTVVSTVLSFILGIFGALGRIYGPPWLRTAILAYVELIRGLPPILQLFIIFFGLTQFGIDLPPFTAAMIWLVIYGTGYAIEVFRAGIQAVADGQREAATAVGMGFLSTLRKVVMPQAFVLMLPPLTNFVIIQLKNTTLVYFIGVADIMYQAQLGADATEQPGTLYALAAVAYLIMNGTLSRIAAHLERKAAAYR